MKEYRMKYKSRFELPIAESDFVCALARILNADPDDTLRVIVRMFAKSDPDFAREVWRQAGADGRGPWSPPH